MIQTKEKIEREIRRMKKYGSTCKDRITARMIYVVSETLRWAIEDTVSWNKPLEETMTNANILKEEMLNSP